MWWPVVFVILLIPLIIAEVIIFIKTKKLSWLIYALSIFTYVIAVCYTLDVFDAGRNAVILTLLASAILMALIGRRFAKSMKKEKRMNRGVLITTYVLIGIIVVIFVVSVIAGKGAETITPVDSIKASDLIVAYDAGIEIKPMPQGRIALLERTVTNNFFLPIPIVQQNYRVCVPTQRETIDLWLSEDARDSYPEVGPMSSESITVYLQAFATEKPELYEPSEVLVYLVSGENSWVPCAELTMQPTYRIPVTQ